ncbi:MAG: hypothetical protein KIT09_00090 [Bryobacteraceae bacterium]|nr:hypothetical protein [Bryobacteraceae bacterium]
MARTYLYFKIEVEHPDDERIERLAADFDRQIRRVHGVLSVELTNSITNAESE